MTKGIIQMKPSNCFCDLCETQSNSLTYCLCSSQCENVLGCGYLECNKLSPESINMVHEDFDKMYRKIK